MKTMRITQEALLQEMKLRPNLSPDDLLNEALLLSYLSEIQEKIKAHCKRRILPDALFYTIVSMAVDLYCLRTGKLIVSESQGSRSLTYAGKNDVDSIISGYAAELNRYRRVRVI